jgi:starch-binding outer membrane protein, SusD/RagB family
MQILSFIHRSKSMKVFFALIFIVVALSSCKKFLDAKTDKKLVVPTTLQDAQALLDSYSLLNAFYPSIGEQSDDDFYLLDTYWNSIGVVNQNNYTWAKDNYNNNEWRYLYQMVLYTNVALETLESIPDDQKSTEWGHIKGAALFFRAYAFYQVAQYYAVPYDKSTAAENAGIPLRLTSNVSTKITRSSLEETYARIIEDYKGGIQLLPVISSPVSRPSKAAAYGALSRTYLTMGNYELGEKFADSCLQLSNTLINYNTLNTKSATPFVRFNNEVIFPSVYAGTGMLSASNWHVDSLLYQSYDSNDLRRSLFYKSNGTSSFGFKGNYDGTTSSSMFNGIAVDEVYLIRAECKARLGDKDGALKDLNTLLVTRWKTGTFTDFVATTADEALQEILTERRKELVLRGLRWFDLRRLNKDPKTSKTLLRNLNGQIYQLPPGDPRYTQYIPQQTIDMTGIEQNTR